MPSQQYSVISNKSNLPPQAHLPKMSNHEPYTGNNKGITGVNSVQHAIRAGVAENGLEEVERVVANFGEFEAERMFPDVDEFRTSVEQCDQFVRESLDTPIQRIEEVLEERQSWYNALLNGEYGHAISVPVDNAKELRRGSTGVEVAKVTVSEDPTSKGKLHVSELPVSPTAFGYELPHTFYAAVNVSKESRYPLVPWYGTVVCLCHFKQSPRNKHLPCCKHELAIVDKVSKNNRRLRELPNHYSKLVSPYGRRLYRDLDLK